MHSFCVGVISYRLLKDTGFVFRFIFYYSALKLGNNVTVKVFYNLSFFLTCMIFLTIFSVMVCLPGKFVMALIIFSLAFHLSLKFLARK